MKKLLVMIGLLVMGGTGWSAAATATPTLTPTPTYTPGPQPMDTSLQRIRFSPRFNVSKADGVNIPGLTPVPGDAGGWYSQVQNQSILNVATGTASTFRFVWEVPANIQRGRGNGIQAYIYASNSLSNAAAVAVSFSVNVYRQPYMALSGTVSAQVMLGLTVNANAWGCVTANSQTVCAKDILRDNMVARYPLPMPVAITQCAAGDILNFEVVRSGATGDIRIRMIEVEWNPQNYQNAMFPDGAMPSLVNYYKDSKTPIDIMDVVLGPGAYIRKIKDMDVCQPYNL